MVSGVNNDVSDSSVLLVVCDDAQQQGPETDTAKWNLVFPICEKKPARFRTQRPSLHH